MNEGSRALLATDVHVDVGRRDVGVPQRILDEVKGSPVVERVGRVRVTHPVGSHPSDVRPGLRDNSLGTAGREAAAVVEVPEDGALVVAVLTQCQQLVNHHEAHEDAARLAALAVKGHDAVAFLG